MTCADKTCQNMKVMGERHTCNHPECRRVMNIPGMLNDIIWNDVIAAPKDLHLVFSEDWDRSECFFPFDFVPETILQCDGFEEGE